MGIGYASGSPIGSAVPGRSKAPREDGTLVLMAGGARRRIMGVLFLGSGVWAAVAAIRGNPVLGALAAFVLVELGLVQIRVATVAGGVIADEDATSRVTPLLAEVSGRARCPAPRVVLRNDSVRVAGVRGSPKKPVLVLSRPYLDCVDDAALTALLAHEVAHIVRGDISAARWRALGGVLCGYALAILVAVAGGANSPPVYLAAFFVGTFAASALLSLANRFRETRADREGAELAMDPLALARALMAADAFTKEIRARLFGRSPWRWLLAPVSWTMPTHPPMPQRVLALQAQATGRDG